jgi:hypothetical protein
MSNQDDTIIVDLGSGVGAGTNYISGGAGVDTITLGDVGSSYNIDTSMFNTSVVPNGGYTISSSGAGVNWTQSYGYDSNVNITGDGITMKEGSDIKIGGKSLTEAIEKIEERLGILHPNEALESRWEELKSLRQQYLDLEKELLEKEKMWKILKEK